jgi:hypothetical protein
MKHKLTYANVMATVAVGLVLAGGVAYAVTAPKNSVRSISIKNGQVTARDLAGLRIVTDQKQLSDPIDDEVFTYGTVGISCRKKESLISGGGDVSGGTSLITASEPSGPRSWTVSGGIDGGSGPITARALCLPAKP